MTKAQMVRMYVQFAFLLWGLAKIGEQEGDKEFAETMALHSLNMSVKGASLITS